MPRVFIKVKQIIVPPNYQMGKVRFSVSCLLTHTLDRLEMPCEINGNLLNTKQIFAMTVKDVKRTTAKIVLNKQVAFINKIVGCLQLPLKWFTKETVVQDWFPMKSPQSEQAFMFQVQVHITSDSSKKAFQGMTSQLAVRPAGWEEPFLTMQPTFDMSVSSQTQEVQEQEEDSYQFTSQASTEETSETNDYTSIPDIFLIDGPLISLRDEQSRKIELY